jgi:N-acetylmuramoyl-L-alanine amidase
LRTIIVDAGHGGKAMGAKGTFSYEKDICLDIALKLGKKLETEFPDLKILYTRTSDVIQTTGGGPILQIQIKEISSFQYMLTPRPKLNTAKFAGYKTQVYYTGKGKKRKKTF